MDCFLSDKSLSIEGGEIVGKVKEESLKTPFYETILFYMCIPFIVTGLISNGLVLWIWLSVDKKFHESVYLFKALAVADFLFLASYIFARLQRFRSAHFRLFFYAICYGSRYISNYITLILAITRFIMLFFPLNISKMLSHFRLNLYLMLIVFFISLLTTLSFAFPFFYGQNANWFYNYILAKVIMTIIPVLAQNMLMLMVVLKLRRFSKTFLSTCDVKILQLSQQGQILHEQKNKIEPAQKLGILSSVQPKHQLALEHREKVCDVGPRNPWIPLDREETAQSDQTTEGELKQKQESVVFDAQPEIIQERDPIPVAEPQKAKQGNFIPGPESSPCDDRSSTLQPMSASSKLQMDINRGIVYVVLGMCLCTFVSEVLCAVVKFLFYKTDVFQTPMASYSCNVTNLISHSINVVFYLFISSFRQALVNKGRQLMKGYTSTRDRMKGTHRVAGDTDGRLFDTVTNMTHPHRSEHITTSKINVCPSSKFPHGHEETAASSTVDGTE